MDRELDSKESWALKNWYFWTVILEKTLESPLDCKEIQPVHPKENQCWIFIGRTDAEAETSLLWPPDAKNWLIGKTLMLGKVEGEGDDRGWDGWMASLTGWTWDWASSGVLVMDREAFCTAVHKVAKSRTWVSNWTEPLLAKYLECNPEIPFAPGEEHWLLNTSLDEVYWPCSHSRAIPSFPSQLEWKIGLPWANTRGILNSPS